MLEDGLRERREPADAALQRVGFVFAHNPVRSFFAVGALNRYGRAKARKVARLLFRTYDDRLAYAFLSGLGNALIARCLRRRELLLQTLVALRRDIIRVRTLRTLWDDFGIAVVFFDQCAAHGKLPYTRFSGKQDGGPVDAVLAQGLKRQRTFF